MIDIPRAATNFRYFADAVISPKLDRINHQGRLASVATRGPVGESYTEFFINMQNCFLKSIIVFKYFWIRENQ